MASEEPAASHPIHQKSAPSPEFAVKELRRATDKRPRSIRGSVQPLYPVTAFLRQAIVWDFAYKKVYSRFPSANRTQRATTPRCAPELRPARTEFPAAGLLHLPHERRRS